MRGKSGQEKVDRLQRTVHCPFPAGFSLLELIAAMTLLVVVIGILGRVVTDTQRVWRQGADRARITTSARTAWAMLEDDLSAAIIHSNLVFHLKTTSIGNSEFQDLILHRIVNPALTTNRAIQRVHWFTQTNALERMELRRASTDLLFDSESWHDPALIESWAQENHARPHTPRMLDALSTLSFRASPDWPDDHAPSQDYDSVDNHHRLPVWIDLQAGLLPDRMARRIPPLSEREKQAHAVEFFHRFHLRNREGGRLP